MRGAKAFFLVFIFSITCCNITWASCQVWVANKTCTCEMLEGGYVCRYLVDSMCSGTDYYNTSVITSFKWASTDSCSSPAKLQTSGFSALPGVPYTINLVGYDSTGVIGCSYNDTLICEAPAIIPKTYNCSGCENCTAAIEEADYGDIINLFSDISEASSEASSECIALRDKNNITFDCNGKRIRIESNDSEDDFGIYISGGSKNTIKNCVIGSFGVGIYIDESSDNRLINNRIENSSYNGIYTFDSPKSIISGNSEKNSSWKGIYINYSPNSELKDNTVSQNEYGIYADESESSKFTNNTAQNNSITGIQVVWSRNNTVTQNRAEGNDVHGIDISLSDSNTISGNTVRYNYYGIDVSSSDENTISNNAINQNEDSGLSIASSDQNVIQNNTLNGNGNKGIDIYNSETNEITENYANANENEGLSLWEAHGSTFTGNTLRGNLVGIYFVDESNNNTFTENIVRDNREEGVYISFSINNSFNKNTIENNEWYGFVLTYSYNNTLAGNRICQNIYKDLRQLDTSENTGTNNTCDTTYNWNDTGADGCESPCGTQTTTTTSLTTTTISGECALTGDNPPCGEIALAEVVDAITAWATGGRSLQEVISLINAWASSI